MSEWYEFSEAHQVEVSTAGPGGEAGYMVVADGHLALTLSDPQRGALVISGTQAEIATLLRRALVEVQCAEVLPVGRADGRARKATNYLEQAEALPVWPAIGTGGNR